MPTSGPAWNSLVSQANKTPTIDLSDLNADGDVVTLAKALVYARTGDATKRAQVVDALVKVQSSKVSRALELGRGLGAYVLAADYIGYRDPAFVSWVRAQLTRPTSDKTIVTCDETRGNNWKAHCGASRTIAGLYLRDTTDLARTVKVFRGWLGDRTQYTGFDWGDLSWQADASKPVGINPKGAVKSGVDIDGVIPDDLRRGGTFPTVGSSGISYSWEALQGVTLQAEILRKAGYDSWAWSDAAICRAADWLALTNHPAAGDDTWVPFLLDARCGTNRAGNPPSNPGKGFGYADWIWP